MKKIIKIMTIILILICITACGTDNSELITNQEYEVTNKISDVENVTANNIKESFEYINANIEKTKNKEVLEKLAYHANYLSIIGNKSELNKTHALTNLGNTTKTYLIKLNKKDKKEVDKLLNDIEDNIDELSEDFYSNYHIIITINESIKKSEIEVASDLIDSKKFNTNNISKAIDYISTYINDPLKNSEVIEKIIYYGEYLLQTGVKIPENEITLLGKYTKEYLKNLDNENKKNALNILNEINKDRKNKIEEFYNTAR